MATRPFRWRSSKSIVITFSGLFEEKKIYIKYDDCLVSHKLFNTAFGSIHVKGTRPVAYINCEKCCPNFLGTDHKHKI